MNVDVIGPRASGKTTIGNIVASEFNLKYVSLGKLARIEMREKTSLGNKMQYYMDNMIPYPEGFLQEFIHSHLKIAINENSGFVLDGYPRRKNEGEEFVEILKILNQPLNSMIELCLGESEILERANKRLWCSNCDLQSTDSTNEHNCTNCGNTLTKREDDDITKLRSMNELYLNEKDDVISVLTLNTSVKLVTIDASKSISFVVQAALESLEKIVGNKTKL